jgi:hypothetical protein
MDRMVADFSHIPAEFAPFTEMPDPAAFDPLIRGLEKAMGKLSQDATVTRAVSTWDGGAAQDFAAYLDALPTVLSNNFLLATVVKSAMQAEQEIWVRARADICALADQARQALYHFDDFHAKDWEVALSVVGAVIALPSAVATGGASLALWAVAAGSASVAGTLAGQAADPPTYPLSGPNAGVIVDRMRTAIAALTGEIYRQEIAVATALTDTLRYLDWPDVRRNFVQPRPALDSATSTNVTSLFGVDDAH